MLFAELALRTDARIVEGFQSKELAPVLASRSGGMPLLRRMRPRSRVASTEMLATAPLASVVELGEPVAVAVYDDPVAQAAALGVPFANDVATELLQRRASNTRAFRWQVVPTASFAELVGLDPDRVIVGANGTDTTHIQVEPWPQRPSVAFISGAAPGRGIDALVEAGRRLRGRLPDLEILLWLVGTGEGSRQYLDTLHTTFEAEPWVRVETTPYSDLSAALGRATVMCIPHPANVYFDVMLPVKLLDSMAAGRPLVVTPRKEMAAIVERFRCGLVTRGDGPDDLAESIGRLLDDESLARTLGRASRDAAEREYEWSVIGNRVADEILRREGVVAAARLA